MLDVAKFNVSARIKGFDVPDTPSFDREAQLLFRRSLEDARLYVEFGSGGSTVLAARLGKSFVSVESDSQFLEAVAKKIGPLRPDQCLIHSSFGINGPWGSPVLKTPRHKARWRQYIDAPWVALEKIEETPDLVLIDGRFRTACVLNAIRRLRGAKAVLLFDDYVDRPFYHSIERFADIRGTAGSMVVLVPKRFETSEISEALNECSTDWR